MTKWISHRIISNARRNEKRQGIAAYCFALKIKTLENGNRKKKYAEIWMGFRNGLSLSPLLLLHHITYYYICTYIHTGFLFHFHFLETNDQFFSHPPFTSRFKYPRTFLHIHSICRMFRILLFSVQIKDVLLFAQLSPKETFLFLLHHT